MERYKNRFIQEAHMRDAIKQYEERLSYLEVENYNLDEQLAKL